MKWTLSQRQDTETRWLSYLLQVHDKSELHILLFFFLFVCAAGGDDGIKIEWNYQPSSAAGFWWGGSQLEISASLIMCRSAIKKGHKWAMRGREVYYKKALQRKEYNFVYTSMLGAGGGVDSA